MKVNGNELKVLVAGDIHCNLKHAKYLIKRAAQEGIPRILQTGDFGFIWRNRNGELTGDLDALSRELVKRGINLFWVEGNHEDYELLRELGATPDDEDMVEVAPNIWHIPRGHVWTWDGVRFLGLGGAVSVDRGPVVTDEIRSLFREKDLKEQLVRDSYWWPEESITQRQVYRAIEATDIDVMVTHDAYVADGSHLAELLGPPSDFGYKADRSSWSNRQAIAAVVEEVQPNYLFHGHYHYRYNDEVNGVRVVGLDRDKSGPLSYVVFDLERYKNGSIEWNTSG